MPSLANIPKAWWGRLQKLSNSPGVDATRLQEFIRKPPLEPEICTLAASDMTPTDVNEFFGLAEAQGYEAWQFPYPLITLRPDFETWIEMFTELTSSSKPTEARTRCKIDALLFTVYDSLKARGLLDDGPKVTLQFETSLEWGPITYHNKPHKCVGKADYSMFFGGRDHMACHLVILETKKDHQAAIGQGQILAYMAMVHASRKARGQSDSTVWGALTDGHWFYFFRLSDAGKWSVAPFTVSRDGWVTIANIMAYVVLQGYQTAASPLRSSLSTNLSARQSVVASKAPRIPSISIQEAIDENLAFFSTAS